MYRYGLVLFLAPAFVFGQLSWNAVTVTASRAADVQTDQAVYGVFVSSGLDKGFDEIVAALQGVGITAANFAGVYTGAPIAGGRLGQTPMPVEPGLQWAFRFTVPLSKVKETAASLTALQQSLAQKGGGLSLSFSLQGTQTSQAAPNCSLADLLADARAQAVKIVGAAGFTPGAVQALTSGVSSAALPLCTLTVRYGLGATFGQTDPNTITVTALRTTQLQPDQVITLVTVITPTSYTPDDAAALLEGSGITGARLQGVSNSTISVTGPGAQPQPIAQWTFNLVTPLSKIKDTMNQLIAAQQAVAKKGSGLMLAFSPGGTQVSEEARKAQACPHADLLADARGQAQKAATAAGVVVGGITSMSGGESASAVIPYPTSIVPVIRAGDFSGTTGTSLASLILSPLLPSTSPAYSCSMAVQFQMLRK